MMSEHDDAIREALAAERAAAYAQLDPDEFEELIWATHAALEARTSLVAESRDAEGLARAFHEAYERLAPSFGYETREASAVPWDEVPEPNKSLMIAAADALLAPGGPVQVVEATAEPSDDKLRSIARNATGTGYYSGGVKALRAVWNESRRPYVGNTRKGTSQ